MLADRVGADYAEDLWRAADRTRLQAQIKAAIPFKDRGVEHTHAARDEAIFRVGVRNKIGFKEGVQRCACGSVRAAIIDRAGRATRVSVAAPHECRPWTEHSADARADGDRLFAHLEGHESDYWWASRAYARHGRPSRRFSLMRGGTGGGTPALVNALHAALGPYVSDPEPGALMVARAVHETGLSPPMGAFVSPIRLALAK